MYVNPYSDSYFIKYSKKNTKFTGAVTRALDQEQTVPNWNSPNWESAIHEMLSLKWETGAVPYFFLFGEYQYDTVFWQLHAIAKSAPVSKYVVDNENWSSRVDFLLLISYWRELCGNYLKFFFQVTRMSPEHCTLLFFNHCCVKRLFTIIFKALL